MIRSLITILVFVFSATIGAPSQTDNYSDVIYLGGKIQSIDGQPIPEYSLTFESNNRVVLAKTDNEGKYFVILPFGIYDIFSLPKIIKLSYKDESYIPRGDYSYFRPYRRAKLNLTNVPLSDRKGRRFEMTLDIVLVESASIEYYEDSQVGLFRQDAYNLTNRIKYETIKLGTENDSQDLVIQYSNMESKNDTFNFFSSISANFPSVFGAQKPFVIVTYDKLTIYADSVTLDRKKKIVVANNAKVFDSLKNGMQSQNAKRASFDFSKKVLKIKLEN